MKKCMLCFTVMAAALCMAAQSSNPKYDRLLADSLGGDEYGMKMYVFVILKTGPATFDQKTTDSLFQGHMANIGRLAKEGKLVVAGPLKKNDRTFRGIFILNAATVEEANRLLATDPAVKERLLDAETFQWYGSAALPTYLPNHEKIQKKKM